MTTTPTPDPSAPLVSVFTASHDPRFLADCWRSLRAQTVRDFEWVVLLNNGAEWSPPDDSRIRVERFGPVAGVGQAKALAVELCSAPYLLELDHDDVLARGAIAAVIAAFEAWPDAGLVYSHCASLNAALEPCPTDAGSWAGWEHASAVVDGREVTYPVSMAPTPHNLGYIWFAPNHLRAFTRVAYDKAGGYNPDLEVLDDQDLMCRLYEVGPFKLVDQVLYGQRLHDARTSAGPADQPQTRLNAAIQAGTVELYDAYIERLALAWSHREGLEAWDLGAYHNRRPGWVSVDARPGPDVDRVLELPRDLALVPSSSVGVIRAFDFLEHVADKIGLITELHRILVPGGLLLTCTPAAPGGGAWQDPTHVAFYNEGSFRYYTEPGMRAFVAELEDAGVAFQTSRLVTWPPPPLAQVAQLIAADVPVAAAIAAVAADTRIPYVTANLIAIKDPRPARNGGELHW